MKKGSVLPYAVGRHVPHDEGDVVLASDLSDALQRRLASGDRVALSLLQER